MIHIEKIRIEYLREGPISCVQECVTLDAALAFLCGEGVINEINYKKEFPGKDDLS